MARASSAVRCTRWAASTDEDAARPVAAADDLVGVSPSGRPPSPSSPRNWVTPGSNCCGVPPLNNLRRQLFAKTNDGQLTPYTDWSDFGQHLKHPEPLINFVAAYGHHPSITSKTTLAGKRAAAKAIMDPTTPPATNPADIPADAAAFMFSTGEWTNEPNGVTTTGVHDVDLWVGGLAEITNVFGGILGSTFNYVFQNTLEDLQEGDRLYYLARTPGLNLRAQLEGNSFAELIQRNTDGTHSLKADAFATADGRFELKNLSGTAADFVTLGSTVADDPGNDILEGNGGDDVTLGGDGNDRITDLAGADVLKGGPGNDALDGGPGDDIPMGGDGADFINGGANDSESAAGEANDFVLAGQVGENDYDAEGGDDILSQNAAIDRNAGSGGFDWAIHQYDTVGADDDMAINNNLLGVPLPIVVNRDRWPETEANFGSAFNDVIRGDDDVP